MSIRVCAPPGAQVGGRVSCSPFTWLVGGAPHLARASQLPMVTLGPAVLRLGSECPSPNSPAATHPGRWSAHSVCSGDFRQLCGVGGVGLQLRALQGALAVALVGDLELQAQVLSFLPDIHLHRWGGRSSGQAHRCVPGLGRAEVGLVLSNFFPGGGGTLGLRGHQLLHWFASRPAPPLPGPRFLCRGAPFKSPLGTL